MNFNKNNYVTFQNYNKLIQEKFVNSNYDKKNMSYPYKSDSINLQNISNFTSSGVVSTNPVYNVVREDPGLSWI